MVCKNIYYVLTTALNVATTCVSVSGIIKQNHCSSASVVPAAEWAQLSHNRRQNFLQTASMPCLRNSLPMDIWMAETKSQFKSLLLVKTQFFRQDFD